MTHPVPIPQRLQQQLTDRDDMIAVTGATGWFGRATLELLHRALGQEAFERRVQAYASTQRTVQISGVGAVTVRPLQELQPADLLLHYAYITQRGHRTEREIDTFVRTSVEITTQIVAAIASGRVRRLIVTSSGAAHHPDLTTNPYGTLKALDELVFPQACRQMHATCVIARVFNVAGAHITHPDSYALGNLIRQAHAGGPLTLAARGDVIRSYTGVEEIVLIALGEAFADRSGLFETAGTEQIEVEELAHAVLKALGRDHVAIRRDRDPSAEANVYVGDGERLRHLAIEHDVQLRSLDALIAATATAVPPVDPEPSPPPR
jgi:nucleoside-diphosphate-sugar epimerase